MAVTHYTWDPLTDNVMTESDENGATTAVYTHKPEQYGKLISQHRDDATSYYHYDGQGSTRQLTDENGDVTDTSTYTAFGEEVAKTGATTNPFGYKGATGYYANPETDDVYVRARTYQPAMGRWLSVARIGFFANEMLADPYAYAANNRVGRASQLGVWVGSSLYVGPIEVGLGKLVFQSQIPGKDLERAGNTTCNLSGKEPKMEVYQTDCRQFCTFMHELVHVRQLSKGCCPRARQAFENCKDIACAKTVLMEWEKWLARNEDALECPAYRVSLACSKKRLELFNCQSCPPPPKNKGCCDAIKASIKVDEQQIKKRCPARELTKCPFPRIWWLFELMIPGFEHLRPVLGYNDHVNAGTVEHRDVSPAEPVAY